MTTTSMRDLEALAGTIGPQDVRDYLRSRNWSSVNSRRSIAAIFRKSGEGAPEVLIPLDRQLGDYADAMLGAAKTIADSEGRSVEAVLRDLRHPRRDILRFALEGEGAYGGSVKLFDGTALVAGARKALLASACSVERPGERFYPRMSLAAAESFVERCALGQTESGSFVISIEAPIETEAQVAVAGEEPFGRRASVFMMRALGHLYAAVTAGNPERVLEPRPGDPIVAANLCEALTEMAPRDGSLDLRIRGSWSPIIPPPQGVPTTVYFERTTYGVIESLGQQLRPARGPKPAQFVGIVSQLTGEPGESGRVEGDVQLTVQVEEELLHVRVRLGAEDYSEACRAHVGNLFIKVRGVLHRGARIHRLADPVEFTVIDA